MERAGIVPLQQLIDIILRLFGPVLLVTGNEGYVHFSKDAHLDVRGISHKLAPGLLRRTINYALTQMRIVIIILRESKKIRAWIFFIGGEGLLLPMLAAKICRKKVTMCFAGYYQEGYEYKGDRLLGLLDLAIRFNCFLADRIILYSPNLIQEWGFQPYTNKIRIARHHSVNMMLYKNNVPVEKRGDIAGYIGRFRHEKGILELMRAIPLVVRERDVRFVIIGEGEMQKEMEEIIREEGVQGNVEMAGWVPHDQLPQHLNRLKLLVIPSYTEGLPNVLLEALSCGTPILATPVGSIPWIIRSGVNGYILSDNRPSTIAREILRVLNDPHLPQVVKRGEDTIREQFTEESILSTWKDIFADC